MSEISFTSAIRPISLSEFGKVAAKIGQKNSVDYPWTIKESVKAANAYTEGICDCTMLGISDGKDVLMMHLCPTIEANHHLFNTKMFIAHNIDLNSPNLQAILVGSKPDKKSSDVYNKLVSIIKDFKIPFSELKIGDIGINVAYCSNKDEWLVSSFKIDKLLKKGLDSENILKQTFKKVNLSELDEII